MITVYVLRSVTVKKRYIGITSDLPRRLGEHQCGATKAGQILGNFRLVHREEFHDYTGARAREKFLKSGKGRAWLNQMLEQPTPAKGHGG